MLQNCTRLTNEEPDSVIEEWVTTFDHRNENIITQTEDENEESVTVPPIQPESEASVWCLCSRQQRFMLAGTFTAKKKKF